MRNNASLPAILAVVTSLAAYAGCEPDKGLQTQIDSATGGFHTAVQDFGRPTDPRIAQSWQPNQPNYNQQGYTQQPYSQQQPVDPATYSQQYGQPTPQGRFTNAARSPQVDSAQFNAGAGAMPPRRPETILVGSFNIQTFGTSKVKDPWVMERLAEVIRMFDVVGIQEIRSIDQTILDVLIGYVNSSGGRYTYVIGPRLGRTVSKEQYAYIYDSDRIASSPNATYTLNDDIDALHREPLIGRFVAKSNLTNRPWTFTLVNLHTDPDEAIQEVNSMGGIMREIRNYEFAAAREDDCLLLGDLNAAPAKMAALQSVGGVYPLISNQPTNVRESELYDNILIEPTLTNEYTGRSGVLILRNLFGITMNDALKLSDHNPIWAEFSIEERGSEAPRPNQQMATQPNFSQR